MKFIEGIIAIPVVLLAVSSCKSAEISMSTNRIFTSQITESWGWMVAHERDVAGIEINDSELQAFLKGVESALKDGPPPFPLDQIFTDTQTLAGIRRKKIVLAETEKNSTQADAFFAGLQIDTNIVRLPDGLCYQVIQPGKGAFPKSQQTVNVHFTGRSIDTTEFIQIGPSDLILVTNHLNRGLFEGIQKINAGGRIKIFVPPALAKEDWEKMGTPPGSAMVFDVELFSIKDTAPQDLTDALTPPAPEPPPAPLSGNFSDAQIIEEWGWNIAQQVRVAKFELSRDETVAFLQGLSAGIQNQPPPQDLEKIQPLVEAFVADRLQRAQLKFKQNQLAQNDAFFAGLKKETNVVFLPDGLAYQILQPGNGPFPKTNQVAKVNYTGHLIGGKIFDATDASLGPLDIDPNGVIAGWREGIQKINRGGKIRLYIPPELGYNDTDTSGIPPYSTLIFDIELLELNDPQPH